MPLKRQSGELLEVACHEDNQDLQHLKDIRDAARYVAYAAEFLKTLYAQERTWTLAVARYHAGPNNDAAQKRYVCVVIANMVATGFGKWTAASKTFCGRADATS